MIQFHSNRSQLSLGYIPVFFSENDPRPASEQLDEAYAHGGGFKPFNGFNLVDFHTDAPLLCRIEYPGDPAHPALAYAKLRDETLVYFQYDWLAIVQPDHSFQISRID